MAVFQLLRFPWAFVACADVVAGYALIWFFTERPENLRHLPYAAAAAVALALAAQVWGDIFELDDASRLAPDRPLPSGRLSVTSAFLWATALTFMGLMLTMPIGADAFQIALALMCAHLLYQVGGRRVEIAGPLLFGAARGLAMVLGMRAHPEFWVPGPAVYVPPALLGAFCAVAATLAHLEQPWPPKPPRRKQPKTAATAGENGEAAPAPAPTLLADGQAAATDNLADDDDAVAAALAVASASEAGAVSAGGAQTIIDDWQGQNDAWRSPFGQGAVSQFPLPLAAMAPGRSKASAPPPSPLAEALAATATVTTSPASANGDASDAARPERPALSKPPGEAPVSRGLLLFSGVALLALPWGVLLFSEWERWSDIWPVLVLVLVLDVVLLGKILAALARPVAATARSLANSALVGSILLDAAFAAEPLKLRAHWSPADPALSWLAAVPLPGHYELALLLFLVALALPAAALKRRMPLI